MTLSLQNWLKHLPYGFNLQYGACYSTNACLRQHNLTCPELTVAI